MSSAGQSFGSYAPDGEVAHLAPLGCVAVGHRVLMAVVLNVGARPGRVSAALKG
jgi:hypothetical protein